MKANPILEATLTPMESRIINRMPPSARDIAVHKKQAAEYLNELLSSEQQITDQEGNVMTVTYGEQLIAGKLAYMKEHPESWRLNELTQASSTLNRTKEEVVEKSNAEFFSCIVSNEVVEIATDDTDTR